MQGDLARLPSSLLLCCPLFEGSVSFIENKSDVYLPTSAYDQHRFGSELIRWHFSGDLCVEVTSRLLG